MEVVLELMEFLVVAEVVQQVLEEMQVVMLTHNQIKVQVQVIQ